MTLAEMEAALDAEWRERQAKYKRSGDSYQEGYLDGLERAGIIIGRLMTRDGPPRAQMGEH